jgi:branched-chain amino acid transport system substrate-binding protein
MVILSVRGRILASVMLICLMPFTSVHAVEAIKLGLNYPSSGPYKEYGLSEMRAALLAVDEINQAGGVLGRPLELVTKNSASKPEKSVTNVQELAAEGVSMIFGGVSSAVAIAGGKEAAKHNLIYFGTHTYANETTGTEGHRYMFRESYNAWMASKTLSHYMAKNLNGKRVFYITADYSWGHSSEDSLRELTNTRDTSLNPGVLLKFPRPRLAEVEAALTTAEQSGAAVLVLTEGGEDLAMVMNIAHNRELHKKMTIIVPGLTQDTMRLLGSGVLEGVISAVPWCWRIPEMYGYEAGKHFVNAYADKYQQYPSSTAASTYSIVYQFKDAVERAKSLDTEKLIKTLEGYSYTGLKDRQTWRAFDHQNVQSVFVVQVKSRNDTLKDRFHEDFFDVLLSLPGSDVVQTPEEWQAVRKAAGKPLTL